MTLHKPTKLGTSDTDYGQFQRQELKFTGAEIHVRNLQPYSHNTFHDNNRRQKSFRSPSEYNSINIHIRILQVYSQKMHPSFFNPNCWALLEHKCNFVVWTVDSTDKERVKDF